MIALIPMSETTPDSIHAHHHAVQFYGTDESLFTTVATFLSEGLVAGQPAIVIATAAHGAAIIEHLRGRLIDCDKAIGTGDLLILDAQEMLNLFMGPDGPDPDLFELHVGGLVGRVLDGRTRTPVRAYGEMVDVLWKEGHSDAAIKLEILWNKLALKHNFALLCGYAMGSFYKQTKHLEDICTQHTHATMDDTNVVPFTPRRAAKSA
jgi:DcmR-like sensory protein